MFFGAEVNHHSDENFVVLNSFHPLRLRYFTAAQMLWHISEESELQTDDFDQEWAAEYFAACLMLSKPILSSYWRHFNTYVSEEELILRIAYRAAVPYKIIERQLQKIGVKINVSHSEEEWLKLSEKYSSPLDLADPKTQFIDYKDQVFNNGLNRLTASNNLLYLHQK